MARYIDAYKFEKEIEEIISVRNAVINGKEFPVFLADHTFHAIRNYPPADVVEVKHGKWIKRGNEKKCSVCGFIYYSNNDDWNGCPNCLSKMDGKETNVPTK